MGRELYERLATLGGHMTRLGKGLKSATTAYNSAVGSLESRVLSSARKFQELGVADTGQALDTIDPLETTPRQLQAPELSADEAPAIVEEPES